jgi:hypothetical protein
MCLMDACSLLSGQSTEHINACLAAFWLTSTRSVLLKFPNHLHGLIISGASMQYNFFFQFRGFIVCLFVCFKSDFVICMLSDEGAGACPVCTCVGGVDSQIVRSRNPLTGTAVACRDWKTLQTVYSLVTQSTDRFQSHHWVHRTGVHSFFAI